MAAIDDLKQAVTDLQAEVTDISAEMDKLLAALNAAVGSGNDAAIQQATADLRAQIDALKAAGTRDMPPATP